MEKCKRCGNKEIKIITGYSNMEKFAYCTCTNCHLESSAYYGQDEDQCIVEAIEDWNTTNKHRYLK